MVTVALIRHATTAATGKRLGGWTPGVHLDPSGRAQADAVARRCASLPVQAVYSSPLERTVETARPIARAHRLRVRVRRGLGEVDYGEWTNVPLAQLRRRSAWHNIQTNPSRVVFPSGESIRGAQDRAVSACEQLAAAHGDDTIVVVSHADIIKAIVAYYLAVPLDAFQRLRIDPASVTLLDLPPAGGPPTVHCVNHAGDLPELGARRGSADRRDRKGSA